jgi:5-formyltetrahydrofolate cyclo-ligase
MLHGTKPELRLGFRAARTAHVIAIGAARTSCEQALAAMAAPLIDATTPIASYAARGAEIDPRRIAAGLQVAYPRVTAQGLEFRTATLARLLPGHAGIAEPGDTMARVRPQLLLIPLLAVTPGGTRLGQGGGHYDRAIRSLRQSGPLTTIGVAWDMQLVDCLPVDFWDEPLDWIATPTRLVECAANR